MRHARGCLVAAFFLAGCRSDVSGAAGGDVAFPRLTPEAGREEMMALLPGTLVLEGRCLYVAAAEGDERYLVVWPPSASLVAAPEGLQVVDSESGASVPVRAEGGSAVVLSGGEVGDRRPGARMLAEPIPDECGGPFWIAGEVLEAMPTFQPPPPDPPPPGP